jgi:hypothetical protein
MATTNREKINPSPVIKPINPVHAGSSPLNSRYMDSFVHTRPGDVLYDRTAGAGLRSLAASLSSLEPALVGMLDRKLDRDIEEGIAKGYNIFHNEAGEYETAEMRSKMTWKEFVTKHPEFKDANPYLWKGWEKARNGTHALNVDKLIQDEYTQGGYVNDPDPTRLNAAVDRITQGYREQAGLNNYPNPLDLAKDFTLPVADAKKRILARHTADMKALQEGRLITESMEKMAAQIDQMINPQYGGSATGGIANPLMMKDSLGKIDTGINLALKEMSMNGVADAKLPELKAEAVFTQYHRYGKNTDILRLLDSPINGIRPSSLKDVAAKAQHLRKQATDESYQAWVRSDTIAKRKREKEIEEGKTLAAGAITSGYLKDDEQISIDTPLNEKGDTLRNMNPYVAREALEELNKARNLSLALRTKSPQQQMEVTVLESAASNGMLDPHEAAVMDVTYGTGGSIYKAATSAKVEADNDEAKAKEHVYKQVFNLFTGLLEEGFMGKMPSLTDEEGRLKKKAVIGVERAAEASSLYQSLLDGEKKKSGQTRISARELNNMREQVMSEMKSKYKDELATSQQQQQPLSDQRKTAMINTLLGTGKWTRVQLENMNDAELSSNFNTLFPQQGGIK